MLTIVFGGKIVPPNQTSLETVLKLEMDPILLVTIKKFILVYETFTKI